jgi:hypothetical protein
MYVWIEMKRAADHWDDQRVRDYVGLHSKIEIKRAANLLDEKRV